MKFIIQGTDQSTGQDVRLELDAASELEARRRAAAGGVVVSSIQLPPGEALAHVRDDLDVSEYFGAEPSIEDVEAAAALEDPPPVAQPPHQLWYSDRRPPSEPVPPEYADIISGARWLRIFALVCTIAAAAAVLIGGFAFLGGLIGSSEIATTAGLWGVIYGIYLIGIAAILRMLAAVGLAIRDTARNSFKR